MFPVERGTYLPVEKDEALLWTQESVAGVNLRDASYSKEGGLKPTPSPHKAIYRRWWMARYLCGHHRPDKDGLEQQHALQKAARDACLLKNVSGHHPAKPEYHRWTCSISEASCEQIILGQDQNNQSSALTPASSHRHRRKAPLLGYGGPPKLSASFRRRR